MNVAELEAFWWITQTGSMGRAARLLYLTQPSVTARIRSLENEIGMQLFARGPKGVQLTQAGRMLLPLAERILEEVKRARASVSALDSVNGARLGIAATHLAAWTLPELLARFRTHCPGSTVTVRTCDAVAAVRAVADDKVHFSLVDGKLPEDGELTARPFSVEVLVLVAARAHGLAAAAGDPAALGRAGLAAAREGAAYWDLVEGAWSRVDQKPRVTVEVESLEGVRRMAVSGVAAAVLPRRLVRPDLDSGALVEIPLPHGPLLQPLHLVYRDRRFWPAVAQAFLNLLEGATVQAAGA